jgi:hypothetical protein
MIALRFSGVGLLGFDLLIVCGLLLLQGSSFAPAHKEVPKVATLPTAASPSAEQIEAGALPIDVNDVETLSPEPEEEYGTCNCDYVKAAGKTKQERQALLLACERYSDPDCGSSLHWQVFRNVPPNKNQQRAVVVRRSTGDCGGCGALTFAAVFDRLNIHSSGLLGKFGRFGNGPDRASWLPIGKSIALAVDSHESQGGSTSNYRYFYRLDGASIRSGACIVTSYDNEANQGAEYEYFISWRAKPLYQTSGALDVQYDVLGHGTKMPAQIDTIHVGAERVIGPIVENSNDGCVEPELSQE